MIARNRADDPPLVGLLLEANAAPAGRVSVLGLDDQDAGRRAGRLLLDRGCAQVIFLGRRDIPASRERLRGVEEVVIEAGVQVEFVTSHLNYADGFRLGHEMALPEGETPLGMVTTNDWLAVGLRAGLQHRERPPERLMPIVSFDGLPLTADPALNIISLQIPIETIAEDAVAELQRLLRSQGAVGRVIHYRLLMGSNTSL